MIIITRPLKIRRVCELPENEEFGPLKENDRKREVSVMTVDEYETIRLIDLEELTQEECSDKMNIARTTVQGIYSEARKKLAKSLVNGNILKIEGGKYKLCTDNKEKCENKKGCQKHKRHNHSEEHKCGCKDGSGKGRGKGDCKNKGE